MSITRQSSNYRSFEDFENVEELQDSDKFAAHEHFTATEKVPSREPNPLFENNKWYLLMRRGEHPAQVEKAISKLYRYFYGYATEIDIVTRDDFYFVASRALKDFKLWSKIGFGLVRGPNGEVCYDDNGKLKKIVGLGKLCALTEFFDDYDFNIGNNFGIHVRENECIALKLDYEHALRYDENLSDDENSEGSEDSEYSESGDPCLEIEMQKYGKSHFSRDITKEEWFTLEKEAMLKKIAETDFSIIESILREVITSNAFDSSKWMMLFFQRTNPQLPGLEQMSMRLAQLDLQDRRNGSVDRIINQVRMRHDQLKIQFSCETSIIDTSSTNALMRS